MSAENTDRDTLEQASGLRVKSNYMLADKALRQYVKPADACTVDPMHDAVAIGFVNVEPPCFHRAVQERVRHPRW